jgi:hypothetical protein
MTDPRRVLRGVDRGRLGSITRGLGEVRVDGAHRALVVGAGGRRPLAAGQHDERQRQQLGTGADELGRSVAPHVGDLWRVTTRRNADVHRW